MRLENRLERLISLPPEVLRPRWTVSTLQKSPSQNGLFDENLMGSHFGAQSRNRLTVQLADP